MERKDNHLRAGTEKKLDFSSKQFAMTPFAWSLNAFPAELQNFVLPTDSRRRPDRAALCNGDVDQATAWKRVAETQQRAEQKARRGGKKEDPWTPIWFTQETDHEGNSFYKFTDKYWKLREEQEALKAGGAIISAQIKDTAADFMHYRQNFASSLNTKQSTGISVGDRSDFSKSEKSES